MIDDLRLWPEGEYAMKVERIEDLVVGHNGHYYCRVRLLILGTDHTVIWLISEHPNAEWVWKGPIEDFADREELVGRTFLFTLRHEEWNGRRYERVGQIGEELP
jgi:hypothetical protein